MSKIDQATELLRKAEADLRRLVGEAAETGDYEGVLHLTSWARELASWTAQGVAPGPADSHGARGPLTKRVAPPRKTGRCRSGKALLYPKFFRRGEILIKIGWSKREKKEYRHKTPYNVLMTVAAAIALAGSGNKIVTAEGIMPVIDPEHNAAVPGYQVYICLAWLRQEGLIQQHGREGYTVTAPELHQSRVRQCWQALPTK